MTYKKAILLSISASGCIVAFSLLAQQTATESSCRFRHSNSTGPERRLSKLQ